MRLQQKPSLPKCDMYACHAELGNLQRFYHNHTLSPQNLYLPLLSAHACPKLLGNCMCCNVLQTNITVCLKGRTNGRIHYTLESYHPTTISNITLVLSDQHYLLHEESDHFQRHALQPPSASSAQDAAPKHN